MTAGVPMFRVERERTDQGSAFRLSGRLEGPAVVKLQRLLAGPSSDSGLVMLDLGQLESCDADGVALLVELTKRAHTAGGHLVVRSVPEEIRDMFHAEQALPNLHVMPDGDADDRPASQTQYLYRAGESVPFAYASSRHDFSLVADGSLWAHTSHDWLLAAGSGAVLAHRTRGSYFHPDTGECLYTDHPAPDAAPAQVATEGA
jgi:anti-anti-sigma factor